MAKKPYIKKEQVRIEEPRINNEIPDYPQVRLIYRERPNEKSDKDFSKIVTMQEARAYSDKMILDLIEINTNAQPPVLYLKDYSKHLWELKTAAKQKSKTSTPPLKEIQLSTNISQHDMEVKANKAKEFIADGSKVKVVLRMRGRELGRREQSKESFRNFISMMSDVAVVDGQARDEGVRTIAILKRK